MANKVKFEIVRSDANSWKSLFEQAANIATLIGSDKVINISHSSDQGDAVVVIWYRAEEETNILGIKDPD